MYLYLIAILPAACAFVLSPRLNRVGICVVWLFSCVAMWQLIPGGSRDFNTYLSNYTEIQSLSFPELVSKEPIYSLSVWITAHVGVPGRIYFLVFACLSLLVKFIAISRLTINNAQVIFLYMCSFFFVHEFTQIRVSLALGIWFLALPYIIKNRSRYFLLTMVAVGVHYQAAVGLLLPAVIYVLTFKNLQLCFVVFVATILMLSPLMLFDQLGDSLISMIPDPRTEIYFSMRDYSDWDRPNPFSFICLISFLTPIYALFFQKNDKITSNLIPKVVVSNSLLLGVSSLVLFSSIPVAAFRLGEYFFCLFPVQWSNLTNDRSRQFQVVSTVLIGLLLTFIFVFRAAYLMVPTLGGGT